MITVNKRSNKNGEIISVGVNRGVICKSGANFTKYRGTLAKKISKSTNTNCAQN